MRIWQRNTTACTTSSSNLLWTCNLKVSSGDAANETASAPSTWKLRSGMPPSLGPLTEPAEEPLDLLPHLRSSRQPAPVSPDQPHQPEALVDGCPVIVPPLSHTIHQQRLDV